MYRLLLTMFGLMLLLTGCRSKVALGVNRQQVQDTQTVIEKIIQEPERREALQEIVNSYQREAVAIETQALEIRAQIVKLNHDYDATRDQFETCYAELARLMEKFGTTAKEHSLKAKALCSEDEWKQIAPDKSSPLHFAF